MFAGAAKLALVVMLMGSIGLHWALLQSVAWAGMVVSYSQGGSVAEAVSQTFDGRHPCQLCCLIKKAQSQEQKQDSQSKVSKIEAPAPASTAGFLFGPALPTPMPFAPLLVSAPSDSPPLPPPRRA